MITVGLDLSLCRTGITILKDGEVLETKLVKSKPSGDLPIDELKRLIGIVNQIEETVYKFGQPDIVAIENLAFGVRKATALTQLAGLSYFVRSMLFKRDTPFVLCSPLSLKKFIIGVGKGDKSLMMSTVFKEYGFDSLDDNICDAYALAVLAQAVLGNPIKEPTVKSLEVINLVKKQLCL